MPQTLQFIDPSELVKITDLQLLARTVVEGFLAGLHKSPYSGTSIDFAQYRPYVQGDDSRTVDWALYGRTDRLHVKQYQHETNLSCNILLDCSGSMEYGSGDVTKFHYARMLCACLAMLLSHQKDSIGLLGYHHDFRVHVPSRTSTTHLRRILVELDNLQPEGGTDTARPLEFLGEILPARGMVILISDLLQPAEQVIERIRSLRARRHDVLIFQVSDPAERTFPFQRSATFVDAEDSSEQYAVPDLVRQEYLENRSRHFSTIRSECRAIEIELEEVITDRPLDTALRRFLNHRNHMLTTSSRNRNRTRLASR